jgi:peptidoglycan/LPS O-acetylase OafA/YrhL
VDAFFVLSGFLITSLLLAERQRDGRIRLGAFWLRRARRLLPALLLVLGASVIAYRSLLSSVELSLLRGDALAALGYVANWRMIYRGDGYFIQTAGPSPLQHTWSLGIEEQFYVLWPLAVVALLAIGLRRPRILLGAVCVAGAAASAVAGALLYQPLDVNRSYFGTDTRAQALLIGCALATVLTRSADRPWSRGTTEAAHLFGVLGVGATLALWASTSSDEWLYRGGLTSGGLAVAG